jgi:hypothetical protein
MGQLVKGTCFGEHLVWDRTWLDACDAQLGRAHTSAAAQCRHLSVEILQREIRDDELLGQREIFVPCLVGHTHARRRDVRREAWRHHARTAAAMPADGDGFERH